MRTRNMSTVPEAFSATSCELTRKMGRPTIATMDPIGERLREAREKLGLNMLQASLRCGVDQGTISRLEAGKMPRVAFPVIARVARGLGVSMDELAELKSTEPVPAAVPA